MKTKKIIAMDKKQLIKVLAFPIFILIAIAILILAMPMESTGEKFLLLTLMFVSIIAYTIILLDL